MFDTLTTHRVAMVALLLLTTGLAGCAADQTSDAASGPDQPDGSADEIAWESFEAARDAPGPVAEPTGESPIHAKWLRPGTADGVPSGQNEIHLLIYDASEGTPVEDANVSLASRMPAMGHGTAAEEDPEHVAHGVYRGVINPTMGGQWVLHLTVQPADGDAADVEIEYNVHGDDSTDGMDGEHGEEHGIPSFESFQTAADANGTSTHPNGHEDSPLRMKLLHPAQAHVDGPGEHPVLLLFYDHESSSPVEEANLTLESWMPPHTTSDGRKMPGHGTGDHEETGPAYEHHGVYEGAVHPVMNGTWWLNVTHHPADGEARTFTFEYQVGEGPGSHDGHEEHENETGEHDEHSKHTGHADYESVEEALQANGTVHEPNATDPGPVRLKMLDPGDDRVNGTGERHVVFLLYDNGTREPIEDANFGGHADQCDDEAPFCAWMPAMGHGCNCNETHPEHEAYGVHVAETDFVMGGDWLLRINPTLHDGSTVHFDVPLHVSDDAGDNDDDDGHHEDHDG